MDEYGWVKPVIAKHGEEEKVYVRGARLTPPCPGRSGKKVVVMVVCERFISFSRIAVYSTLFIAVVCIRTEPRPKTAAASRTYFVPKSESP
jgi:hypothetical protein